MLIMAIVLLICFAIAIGHRSDKMGRIMPHEALEQLVSPSDAYLITLLDIAIFFLCVTEKRQAREH